MKKREIRALGWGAAHGALLSGLVAFYWTAQTSIQIGLTFLEGQLRQAHWQGLQPHAVDLSAPSLGILLPVFIFLLPIGTAAGAALLWLYAVLRTDWRQHAWLEIFIVWPGLVGACAVILFNSLPHVNTPFLSLRWKNEVDARRSMLADFHARYKLKGMKLSQVNQLLGDPDAAEAGVPDAGVPDAGVPNAGEAGVPNAPKDHVLGTVRYDLQDHSVLQIRYDKNTDVVTDYVELGRTGE